nr:hypothetical protein [Tanacetum cinerariifolium]
QKKKPQGKVGTQGCPNRVWKTGTEARSFQIAEGEGSGKKNDVQKIREMDTESCYQSSRSKETEIASEKHHHKREYSRRTKVVSESKGSAGGHWKSKPNKQKSSMEDDLSQPCVCEETDPFTPWIRYFDFPKTQMPSHIKTYDGSEDSEDHLKTFQAATKKERWAMPTWCHMFNSTLTGNARKKCIKDPVEIHNIKQRNGESTEEFVRRYKLECRDGEMAASSRERKKSFPYWKQEAGQKQNFKRGNFQNEQRMERKQDRFTLLTKTPREILALYKGKFKPPPSMTIPVEKRNASKFSEFHGEVGHTTDECKDSKEGGNLGERQTAGNINGATMTKDSKAKDHSNFLPEISNFFPTLGEEDGTKGPMIIEAEMGGHCVHR